MIDKIGWVSAILLALCGLPETVITITSGKCNLSWVFLIMWGLGEVGALVYTISKNKVTNLKPLLFNYGLNILFISIMVIYKLSFGVSQ